MSIIIYEPRQELEVETPKGRGRIWLVTEYGSEIEKVFTVILNNGLIWEFTNKDVVATKNITMGRYNVESLPTS
jgi:hypothetical protein